MSTETAPADASLETAAYEAIVVLGKTAGPDMVGRVVAVQKYMDAMRRVAADLRHALEGRTQELIDTRAETDRLRERVEELERDPMLARPGSLAQKERRV